MTRVLVVDDNAQVRGLVAKVLGSAGWMVETAPDEVGALELAAAGPVDLLVTDVSLGGSTGIRLAQGVRRMCPEARVLYVSGHEPAELARIAEAEDLPAPLHGEREAFLRKPFGLAELRDAAHALLSSVCSSG